MRPRDGRVPERDFDLFDRRGVRERSLDVVRGVDDLYLGFAQVFADTPQRYEALKGVDEHIGNNIEGEAKSAMSITS